MRVRALLRKSTLQQAAWLRRKALLSNEQGEAVQPSPQGEWRVVNLARSAHDMVGRGQRPMRVRQKFSDADFKSENGILPLYIKR